jgi:hypothetical protein
VAGSVDGLGTAASFDSPRGITVAPNGDMFVIEAFKIRRVTLAAEVTTVPNLSSVIRGIAVNSEGKIFFSEKFNSQNSQSYRIRRINPDGSGLTVVAGNGSSFVSDLTEPTSISFDNNDILYVAENDSRIRKLNFNSGQSEILAGSFFTGDVDGIGEAAKFGFIEYMAISGNVIYVVDDGNNKIRKVILY